MLLYEHAGKESPCRLHLPEVLLQSLVPAGDGHDQLVLGHVVHILVACHEPCQRVEPLVFLVDVLGLVVGVIGVACVRPQQLCLVRVGLQHLHARARKVSFPAVVDHVQPRLLVAAVHDEDICWGRGLVGVGDLGFKVGDLPAERRLCRIGSNGEGSPGPILASLGSRRGRSSLWALRPGGR